MEAKETEVAEFTNRLQASEASLDEIIQVGATLVESYAKFQKLESQYEAIKYERLGYVSQADELGQSIVIFNEDNATLEQLRLQYLDRIQNAGQHKMQFEQERGRAQELLERTQALMTQKAMERGQFQAEQEVVPSLNDKQVDTA